MPGPISHDNTNKSSFLHTLISSAFGGAGGAFAAFPAENLKKNFQRGALRTSDIINLANGKFFNALKPTQLYRGASSFSASVMMASTTSISLNKLIQLLPFYDSSSKLHELAAAICSGMLGAIVGSTPVENIILTQQKLSTGPIPAIKHLLKQGITRPWAGLPELMAREGGFTGVMLFAGPSARKLTFDKTHNTQLSIIAELAAGAAGSLLTQPFDTIATYRQERDGKIPLKTTIINMYKENGVLRFYRGGIPRIILFTICSISIPRFAEKISFFLDDRV